MTEEEIRKKYQRDGGPLGENSIAVTQFINILKKHEKSNNKYIRNIRNNIGNLEKLSPNFTIFQSEKDTHYMNQFYALSIKNSTDELTLGHEFGHAVQGIVDHAYLTEDKFKNLKEINHIHSPENFEGILQRAKAHALSPENKEKFKSYILYLCDQDQAERTEGEKGPVADIISSIHQFPSFIIGEGGKQCILPSYHKREYYYDEEKGQIKVDKVFSEDFANFYTLSLNNCDKELEILRDLYGEEWMQAMEQELEKVANVMEKGHIPDKTPIDAIKGIIIGIRESQVKEIQIDNEKENTKENIKEGEDRNE